MAAGNETRLPLVQPGLRQALSQLVSVDGRKDGPVRAGKHAFCTEKAGQRANDVSK